MKSLTKSLLSLTLLIAIIALFGYYITNHLSDFQALSIANPWFIIALALITLLSSTFNGMINDGLVRVFGIKLKFKEWFGLSVITTFYNMITPFRGGMAARAVYLNKKYKFPYVHFLASLAGTYVVTFLIASFFGLLSLSLLYISLKLYNPIVLFIFLAFFVPLLIIVLFSPVFPETKTNWINRFIKVLNGWNLIRKNRRVILIVSIVSTLQLLISTVGSIISYHVFGIELSFAQSLFITSLGSLGTLIAITPAGLGVQEAISVFSALVIGISPVQSLPPALLGRAVSMVVIFILGPIFSYLLLKDNKKSSPKLNLSNKK